MFQTNCECIFYLSNMSRLQYFKNYFLLETKSTKIALSNIVKVFIIIITNAIAVAIFITITL